MFNKIIKFSLSILLFTVILATISQTFDGDFGWHLRFGRDAVINNFQYTDSYTWSYFGQNWTNHEWGGDILFWLLYSNFGYYSLVLIITAVVFCAFYLMARHIDNHATIISLAVTLIALEVVSHILVMRLAMFTPLFFIIIFLMLEKIPRQKSYWLLPLLFWFWSALHGSWILGFIVINIYWGGNILQNIVHRFFPRLFLRSSWTIADFWGILGVELVSLLAIIINPYGIKIITEVGSYFTQSYYKSHITEWVPSYTYPVFWGALIFSTLVIFFALLGLYYKKINLAQFFLIAFLYLSGFIYKRNAIFIVLIGIPILTAVINFAVHKIKRTRPFFVNLSKDKTITPTIHIIVMIATFSLIVFFGAKIKIYNNIWEQRKILMANTIPHDAVQFLKNEIGKKSTKIFNDFSWGGYMNWTLPNALVYLDGRGTATWMNQKKPNETLLESYHNIKFRAGGLTVIDQSDAEYVLLRNPKYLSFMKPDKMNELIFGEKIKMLLVPEISELQKNLSESQDWQKIYDDDMAIIWKKISNKNTH